MNEKQTNQTALGAPEAPTSHTAKTSVQWAQRCGELQGRIETLEGERDYYKAQSESMKCDICRTEISPDDYQQHAEAHHDRIDAMQAQVTI